MGPPEPCPHNLSVVLNSGDRAGGQPRRPAFGSNGLTPARQLLVPVNETSSLAQLSCYWATESQAELGRWRPAHVSAEQIVHVLGQHVQGRVVDGAGVAVVAAQLH